MRLVWVWDLPTRLFHWILVGCVIAALATAFIAPASWLSWHVTAGYALATLLLFRFVWAVFGSGYSRVASFAYRPQQVIGYLSELLKLRPPHYVGHNPAGAAMIFALAAVLTALVATGFMVQGGQEKQGPFAAVTSFAVGSGARSIHNFFAYALIALVIAHLAGVFADARLHRSSLVRAMVTGWKRIPAELPIERIRPARIGPAILAFSALSFPTAASLVLLSRLPPLGVPAMIPDKAWATECGGCHYAFHPSLLPRASWAAIMAGLHDHFGEDASLPPAAAGEIAAFLQTYAAEAWDTKAARLVARVAPDDPLRITASPFWVRRHRRLDPSVFADPAVKAKSNCIACHRDTDGGRFDAQAIILPNTAASWGTP